VSRATAVLICVWGNERELLPAQRAGQAGCQLSIFEKTGGGLAAVAHDRSLELFYGKEKVYGSIP
jgi:hypothetical protein